MNPDGSINWLDVSTMLVIRFVGVFVVLAILQCGIYINGAVISRLTAREPRKSD